VITSSSVISKVGSSAIDFASLILVLDPAPQPNVSGMNGGAESIVAPGRTGFD
jgi:hypothetical protein